ncbi:MAG: hypothetical protein C4523_14985 [Myxococcales bacterium]|nr:MAG: hypothetical protein C4523_14985 [Myxococcales bacterium]
MAIASLVLVLAIGISCSEDKKETTDGDAGGDCALDADCAAGQVCGEQGTCEACQACEVRSDCPTGYSCNAERGCCKKVECGEDTDCEDPQYCLDLVCRPKACQDSAECTREAHHCLNGECIKKECQSADDCETHKCNLTTFLCEFCAKDADCEVGVEVCDTSTGHCIDNPFVDGDGVGELKGCDEWKEGCLYDSLICFDKITLGLADDVSFTECTVILDNEGNGRGYAFSFEDGSQWRWYTRPSNSYEAFGTEAYCYKLIPEDLIAGIFGYYDSVGELMGTYMVGGANEYVKIVCGDGTTEWYDTSRLQRDSCPGYTLTPLYSPPSPGIEQCRTE